MAVLTDGVGTLDEWQTETTLVCVLMPRGAYERDELEWNDCKVWYSVLPTAGRHSGALFDITVSVSPDRPEIPNAVERHTATATFPLDVWTSSSEFRLLSGLSEADDIVAEYSYDSSTCATDADLDAAEYLTLELEYLEARSRSDLRGFDSLESARAYFESDVRSHNQNGWDMDPDATYF